MEDVDRQWKAHNPDSKGSITWEEYKKMVYGFMDDMEPSELENNSDEGFSYKEMIRRDQRRWGIADTNGDHALDKVKPFTFLIKTKFSKKSTLLLKYRRSLPTSYIRKTHHT